MSAPFSLQSEADMVEATATEASDKAAIVAAEKLPHPKDYEFSQEEIDKLVAYTEAYSKGKFPDSEFPDVLTDYAKAAREDAHQDLLETNKELLRPQDMQLFLRDPKKYILDRAIQLGIENPEEKTPDLNLCIHIYTRIISILKQQNADNFVVLRTAIISKNKVFWMQKSQTDFLLQSDEAIKLADIVPSVRINGKEVPLLGNLSEDYAKSRIRKRYPDREGRLGLEEIEGDPSQILPHVGYFLEKYLKAMPIGKSYLFGLGLGDGYHSIMIAVKRLDATKNTYIIFDDHMMNSFRIGPSSNTSNSLMRQRQTSDKRIVDYFIQAYTGGAWRDLTDTQKNRNLKIPKPGWPVHTSVYIIRPKSNNSKK